MVLGRIATHNQHHVRILDVDPAVGHCAASEGGPQTGDRGGVSNPRLRFEIADPQAAHRLNGEIVQFVRVSTTAGPSDTFAPIYCESLFILFNKGFITCLFYPTSYLIEGIVPRNILPLIGARPP